MGNKLSWEVQDLSKGIPIKYVHNGEIISAPDLGLKKVEFELKPFSCGRFREAYKGKVYIEEDKPRPQRNSLKCWDFRKKDTDRPCVPCIVKAFKKSHAFAAKAWEKDLTVLKEAQSWSKKFNGEARSTIIIEFASPFLYQVFQPGEHYHAGVCSKRNPHARATVQIKETVCVEPFLDGDFIKANSNSGYVKKEISFNADFLEVAQAFSHWTWAASEKSILICDVQGVCDSSSDEKTWKCTDPAIHCAAGRGRFGLTDLGPRGINAFFSSHKCNDMCRKLPRPEVVIDPGLPPAGPHTTFSFEFEFMQVSSAVHSQEDFAYILDHAHAGTCYAHATATVVRAAERRIVGRKLEEHHGMVQRLVEKYGTKGVSTKTLMKLLEEECHARRLHFRQTKASEVKEAIHLGRAVLLTFSLTDDQWKELTLFFSKSPSGNLSALPGSSESDAKGHSCVIIGHDDQSWKIKNSWGDDFADGGYFKMSKSLLTNLPHMFVDVFWYQKELNQNDIDAYKKHCYTADLHSI